MTELRCGTCGELESEKWVKCSERLPDEGCYLIFVPLYNKVVQGFYIDNHFEDYNEDFVNVSHYMPLPSPPDEVTK